MRIVASSLMNSLDLLALMVFLLSISMLVFSTILYFLEHGELNAETGLYQRDGARAPLLDFFIYIYCFYGIGEGAAVLGG